MSGGRPEFDAGDLVICVAGDGLLGTVWKVYRCRQLLSPDMVDEDAWGFLADGDPAFGFRIDGGAPLCRDARCYRKLDPRPMEFFAGKIEAGLRQPGPAEPVTA